MRLNNWVPSPGCLFDWDIAEILTRESCDVRIMNFNVCNVCNAVDYDGWGFIDGDDTDIDHDCWEDVRDITISRAWKNLLETKREDYHYDDVVASIEEHGFTRPLTAWRHEMGYLQFGDGHHRLAAAIDLGMTTVPVKVYERALIARDSGSWDSGEPIPTLEEVEALR